jgi:hypothetical protein
LAKPIDALCNLNAKFLKPARWANDPSSISEVSLEFPSYRRRRESTEHNSAISIKTLGCGHQSEGRHLDKIVVVLSPIGKSTGQSTSEIQVRYDELASQMSFARFHPRVSGSYLR